MPLRERLVRWGCRFHFTAGLLYNDNRVDATAQSTATLEISGIEFPVSAISQLEGELTDDLSGLGVYPVLSIGVTYQF